MIYSNQYIYTTSNYLYYIIFPFYWSSPTMRLISDLIISDKWNLYIYDISVSRKFNNKPKTNLSFDCTWMLAFGRYQFRTDTIIHFIHPNGKQTLRVGITTQFTDEHSPHKTHMVPAKRALLIFIINHERSNAIPIDISTRSILY